jgi:hypothetical protein
MPFHIMIYFRKDPTIPFTQKQSHKNYAINVYFKMTFVTKVFAYIFIVQLLFLAHVAHSALFRNRLHSH